LWPKRFAFLGSQQNCLFCGVAQNQTGGCSTFARSLRKLLAYLFNNQSATGREGFVRAKQTNQQMLDTHLVRPLSISLFVGIEYDRARKSTL
jgi:hypothetical protein